MRSVPTGPLALAIIVVALVGWALLELAGVGATEPRGGSEPLAIAALAAAVAATVGWWWAHRRTAALRREADGASSERAQARDLAHQLERERQWNRELRHRVVELNEAHGGVAGEDDVRTLVLKVAVQLVEAKRGLLLSRADDDGDGRLDLVASVGFEGDASRSRLAQRFAEEVIERDTIVREDRPGRGGGGADDEISNLVAIPIWIRDDFSGVVVCADRDGGFEACDDEVLLSLGDHAGAVLQNSHLQGRVRASYVATVRLLAEALQAKDPFLRGHSEEVAEHVTAVARRLELDPAQRERLTFASLLHDIGKIGISERILLKPGRLTPEERAIVELHPRIGFRLIEQVPGMDEIAPAILHHHERWDGAGYPSRLRGEDIPLEARVICVADSFSAMTEQRPYRDRRSLDEACEELERCAGTQFDPRVVRLFVEEVRSRRRTAGPGPVAAALADSELEARRTDDEPVLGAASVALTDNLTLLYSHRYFHEAAAAEAERAAIQGTPFAAAIVELGALARINAREGYAAGDDALRDCARAVSRVAVRHGATACRVSGRQVGLLVTALEPAGAAQLADELLRELGPLCEEAGCRAHVAVWQPGEDGESVIERARDGLLRADRVDERAPAP
ncbi:MAG TPA: HD domain-containing phosphohydrolase [Capillimicrobium sp.]